jgi:outer membrane protein insertion porin family
MSCYADGEASLPVRKELANGPVITSLVGYTLSYNTLDNNKNPTNGLYAELKQDFAGVGGDVNFIRTTSEIRNYHEVLPDVVGVIKAQGGYVTNWGGKDLRMLDHFQLGPSLVRGFAPLGLGPRDMTVGTTNDALGGTMFWGTSVEFQTPLYFLPKDFGLKFATFADAGSLWGYRGPTAWLPPSPGATGETLSVSDSAALRSSVGIGLLWDSPLGPIRFDFAYPITKTSYDRTQWFRFGGGTKF